MAQVYLTHQGKYLTYLSKLLTWGQPDPPPIPDEVSVDPTSYNFTTSGGTENVATVSSSIAGSPSSWTATKTSDPNNIVVSFLSAGDDQDLIWVQAIVNSTQHTGCVSATINLVCGDANCDLTITQDGTVESC